MNPLAQTFFVDSESYPLGVYVSSIKLFFVVKDPATIPITLKVGPVNNATNLPNFGVPYQYSTVTLYPSNVIADPVGGLPTTFTFERPIFLAPGAHYFSLETNSNYYLLFSAVQGSEEFGTGYPINLPPYTGLLYLPSDNNVAVASSNEDLKFVINRCVYSTSTGTAYLDTDFPLAGFTDNTAANQNVVTSSFTTFNIGSDVMDEFEETTVTHLYKKTTTSSNVIDAVYSVFTPSTNVEVPLSRLNEGTFKIAVQISTSDPLITPHFNLDRLNGVFIENIINNDTTGETGKFGGSANAKYVTKVIELLPNIEADDLIAFALLKMPSNTDVKFYYKAAQAGVNITTDVNYVEMSRTPIGTPSTDSFVEYKFTTPTGFALSNNAFFSKFMFKIVMLSSDPAGKIPVVKDFRAIALLDS